VAAEGERTVVAYEDPNSERPRVGIALSRSMGHIFEETMLVSSPDRAAGAPQVTLSGDTVRVRWRESSVMQSDTSWRPAERVGIWRR
jgi:hypothetical protein